MFLAFYVILKNKNKIIWKKKHNRQMWVIDTHTWLSNPRVKIMKKNKKATIGGHGSDSLAIPSG